MTALAVNSCRGSVPTSRNRALTLSVIFRYYGLRVSVLPAPMACCIRAH